MRRAAAVIALLLIGGCSSASGDEVPSDLRNRVDRLASEGDCDSLQALFDADYPSETLRYIDKQMQDAGCY